MSESMFQQAAAHLPEALEWLRRMVAINSFTANAAGVDQVGQVTAECFGALGFSPRFVPSDHPKHGHHLYLERPAIKETLGAKPVLLVTHLDTVFPPEEEERNDFHWRPEEGRGRIHGPGVVDNKGGTVLIWLMLRVMLDTMPELANSVHWVVAANAAEEVIGAEFARRTEELFPAGARAVLVFEGGPKEGKQYHLVTSRKGRAEYRIRCLGKAAHAGSSHGEGVNAVVELAKVLPAAAALTDYQRQVSVNIANVHGGTVLNRVPHEAVAELEVRAFDPEVMGDVEERLLGLAGVTAQGARIEVECLGRSPGWPGGEGTEALAAVWEKAAAAVGAEIKRVGRGGLSDANYLCHLGPTLDALGPTGAHAHCSETSTDGSRESEFVEIASFVPKAVINTLALRDFLNR